MLFFLVVWLRTFVHSLPDTFKTLSGTIVEHFRVFFLRDNSCGHTTDFYLGKPFLPRANSSKICLGKFISGFVLPR